MLPGRVGPKHRAAPAHILPAFCGGGVCVRVREQVSAILGWNDSGGRAILSPWVRSMPLSLPLLLVLLIRLLLLLLLSVVVMFVPCSRSSQLQYSKKHLIFWRRGTFPRACACVCVCGCLLLSHVSFLVLFFCRVTSYARMEARFRVALCWLAGSLVVQANINACESTSTQKMGKGRRSCVSRLLMHIVLRYFVVPPGVQYLRCSDADTGARDRPKIKEARFQMPRGGDADERLSEAGQEVRGFYLLVVPDTSQ